MKMPGTAGDPGKNKLAAKAGLERFDDVYKIS